MNNNRRKQIKEINEKLNSIYEELESIRDDEENYLSNMPEGLFTSSIASEIAQSNIGDFDYCLGSIKDITENLQSVIDRKISNYFTPHTEQITATTPQENLSN